MDIVEMAKFQIKEYGNVGQETAKALIAENARLQSIIDTANAQQVKNNRKPDAWLSLNQFIASGGKFYITKKKHKDDAIGVYFDIPPLQQSPAVAVTDEKVPQTLSNARAPRAGEIGIDPRILPVKFTDEQIKEWFGGIKPFCHARKSERGIFATTNDFGASDPLYTIGQVADVLSAVAPEPRITEQDAINALGWLYEVVSKFGSIPDEHYSAVTNAAELLTKLNGDKNGT